MSYANLVNQSCAGFTEEAFQRMRDFICKRNGTYDYSTTGIGWTLHDSHYTVDEDNCQIGDWFVIKSVGEDGKQDLYFRFRWHTANFINIQGMLYWNAATDTGIAKFPGPDTYNVIDVDDDLAFPLWVYGNLDQLLVITKLTPHYYINCWGLTRDLPYDTTLAICAGALSSGSDISITVDIALPSEWAVNRYLYIRDTAHIERIKIKTLNAGTKTITADLVNSYLAGSKLSADLCYQCPAGHQIIASRYILIGHNGALSPSLNTGVNGCYSHPNPDKMNDELVGSSICIGQTNVGFHGKLRNVYKIANSVSGVSSEDVFTDLDGVDWRVFNSYSNVWVMIKEV